MELEAFIQLLKPLKTLCKESIKISGKFNYRALYKIRNEIIENRSAANAAEY